MVLKVPIAVASVDSSTDAPNTISHPEFNDEPSTIE